MEQFEYVVVLTSLILGLGIAQILQGTADIVSNRKHFNISLPHAVYVLVIFIIHIQEWWVNYQYARIISVWTLPIVLGILIFPIILFLQARMLFPTGTKASETDLRIYFNGQWRGLYTLGAITVLISIIHNIYFSGYTLTDQPLQIIYLMFYLVFIVFNVRKNSLHLTFVSLQLLGWVGYIIFNREVL